MGAMTDKYAEINAALDTAEKGLVEAGIYDAQTARALFVGIRPPTLDNVVGNLADLQRQPLMPPGFEQGATAGANPVPTVQPGAPLENLGKTSAQKLADAGYTPPETPATTAEAKEAMYQDPNAGTSTTQPPTAESPQTSNGSNLDNMTKGDLQNYADSNNIAGVDQNTQTKEQMLSIIRGQ